MNARPSGDDTAVEQPLGEKWRTHIKASLSGKEIGITLAL